MHVLLTHQGYKHPPRVRDRTHSCMCMYKCYMSYMHTHTHACDSHLHSLVKGMNTFLEYVMVRLVPRRLAGSISLSSSTVISWETCAWSVDVDIGTAHTSCGRLLPASRSPCVLFGPESGCRAARETKPFEARVLPGRRWGVPMLNACAIGANAWTSSNARMQHAADSLLDDEHLLRDQLCKAAKKPTAHATSRKKISAPALLYPW
jgi:hypothetical protein